MTSAATVTIQASTTVSPTRWKTPSADEASDAPNETAATAAATTPALARR